MGLGFGVGVRIRVRCQLVPQNGRTAGSRPGTQHVRDTSSRPLLPKVLGVGELTGPRGRLRGPSPGTALQPAPQLSARMPPTQPCSPDSLADGLLSSLWWGPMTDDGDRLPSLGLPQTRPLRDPCPDLSPRHLSCLLTNKARPLRVPHVPPSHGLELGPETQTAAALCAHSSAPKRNARPASGFTGARTSLCGACPRTALLPVRTAVFYGPRGPQGSAGLPQTVPGVPASQRGSGTGRLRAAHRPPPPPAWTAEGTPCSAERRGL